MHTIQHDIQWRTYSMYVPYVSCIIAYCDSIYYAVYAKICKLARCAVQRAQYSVLDASKVERYKLWTHTILTNTGKETTTEPTTSVLKTQPDKGKCPNWLTENHSLIQWFCRCCSKTNQKKKPLEYCLVYTPFVFTKFKFPLTRFTYHMAK